MILALADEDLSFIEDEWKKLFKKLFGNEPVFFEIWRSAEAAETALLDEPVILFLRHNLFEDDTDTDPDPEKLSSLLGFLKVEHEWSTKANLSEVRVVAATEAEAQPLMRWITENTGYPVSWQPLRRELFTTDPAGSITEWTPTDEATSSAALEWPGEWPRHRHSYRGAASTLVGVDGEITPVRDRHWT